MIKFNSELPNNLLNINTKLNDYDFVLYHLFIKDNVYRNYYIELRKKYPHRDMIFDNSAYEFYKNGNILDINNFLKIVKFLKPDYFILPDTLMNQSKTIKDTFDTLKYIKNDKIYKNILCNSRPMAVIQGNTEKEFLKCLKIYKNNGIDNICIPFHNNIFFELGKNNNEYVNLFNTFYKNIFEDIYYAAGRVYFLTKNKEYLLKHFKHIHILGSHCPFEKLYYSDFHTMDSGYPVKCGILNIKLGEENKKPDFIIDEFLNAKLNYDQKQCIINNINIIKNLY